MRMSNLFHVERQYTSVMSANRTTIGMAHPTVVPENADAASVNGREEPSVGEVEGVEKTEETESKAENATSDG